MNEMSPIDWALRPLKKYAVFKGRASRAEYWWFYLATLIVGFVISVLEALLGSIGFINAIFNLALAIPSVAVLERRLHDTDRSGWWLLILIIPVVIFVAAIASGTFSSADELDGTSLILVVGAVISLAIAAITLLVFTLLPGTRGPNRYGPDPYGSDGLEEVFA